MRGHDVFISLGKGHALTMNPPRIWCYSPRGPRACIHTRLIFVRLGYMTCGVVETAVQPCVKVYGILIGSTAMSSGIRVRPGSAKIGKAFRYRRIFTVVYDSSVRKADTYPSTTKLDTQLHRWRHSWGENAKIHNALESSQHVWR